MIREKCAFNTNDKDSILGRTLCLLNVIFHLTEIQKLKLYNTTGWRTLVALSEDSVFGSEHPHKV